MNKLTMILNDRLPLKQHPDLTSLLICRLHLDKQISCNALTPPCQQRFMVQIFGTNVPLFPKKGRPKPDSSTSSELPIFDHIFGTRLSNLFSILDRKTRGCTRFGPFNRLLVNYKIAKLTVGIYCFKSCEIFRYVADKVHERFSCQCRA